jgi:predicted O-linked N-acetylglucosamine transferase (SPINDLY family)
MHVGFPGTVGADFMDYFIADKIVAPDDVLPFFGEAAVRMPHSYMPTDNRPPVSDRVYGRKELGLPEDGFVFFCFNNTIKIEPELFRVWIEILNSVPRSVMWLIGKSEAAAVNLKREAVRGGLDPNRLVFSPMLPKPEHLARHRVADLGLDTWTYNGHTTTVDALWMGLPVLTLEGRHFASRVASSLLQAVGLPELITRTRD